MTRRGNAMLVRVGGKVAGGAIKWKAVVDAPVKNERWLNQRGVDVHRIARPRRRSPDRFEEDRLRRKAIEALTSSPSRQVRDPCGCPELLPEPKLLDPHWDADNDPVPTKATHPWRRAW
jgi:hypothetical protein